MPRPKGSQNKVTTEEAHKRNLSLREYLRLLVINL